MAFFNRVSRRSFTLVELMVSMAVFSLLLVMVMSFFSGAQKLVSGNGQNNDVFADARVAMDLMATMLSSTYYEGGANYAISKDGEIVPIETGSGENTKEVGGFLFNRRGKIDTTTGEPSYEMFFAVKPNPNCDFFMQDYVSSGNPMDRRSVYFVRFFRDDNKLFISYLRPDYSSYYKLFPPYQKHNNSGVLDWTSARNDIIDEMKTSFMKKQEILNNVVGLNFIFYKAIEKSPGIEKYENQESVYDALTPPYMIEIQLSLLTQNQMKEYETISDKDKDKKKEYQLLNRRTFTRRVYLGNFGLTQGRAK